MGGIYGEGNYFLEEKKKREGKGGKILEKENMYLMSRKTEKRKGEIFDEQNYVFGGKEKQRRKGMNDFGERKYIFCRRKQNGEGKGGKYLKKDNILFLVEKKIF